MWGHELGISSRAFEWLWCADLLKTMDGWMEPRELNNMCFCLLTVGRLFTILFLFSPRRQIRHFPWNALSVWSEIRDSSSSGVIYRPRTVNFQWSASSNPRISLYQWSRARQKDLSTAPPWTEKPIQGRESKATDWIRIPFQKCRGNVRRSSRRR